MPDHAEAGTIFHARHGNGPPMLVAGGIHLDHGYLRPWLDPLGGAAQLIFVDHPGTGRSREGFAVGGFEHADWADALDRVRQGLGHERVVLFGHSYGGHVALEYALRHPERLRGLVLCATAPAFDYADAALANARAIAGELEEPERFETLVGALSGPIADDAELGAVWRTILPLYFHDYDADAARSMDARSTYAAAAFSRAFFGCLPRFDVTDRLAEIHVPTLVLAGRHDWIAPPDHGADRLQAGLPRSERVIFEASGHFPFVEEPERFTEVVGDWLSRTAV